MDFAPPPVQAEMTVKEARVILEAHLSWRIGTLDVQGYSHRQVNTAMRVVLDATGCRPAPSATRVPL